MKPLFFLLALVSLAAAAIAVRPAPRAEAGEAVTTLEYEAQLPAGPVRYHFQVAARNDTDARIAAFAALAQIAPGATVRDLHPAAADGAVSAAYAFWPWLWDDAELPVAAWYNPAGAPAGVFDASVTDALAPWSAVPGSRFGFAPAGVTTAAPGIAERVTDGRNVIGWQFLGCEKGCVLGVTSKLPDTHEVDIVLNNNPEARIGDGRPGTIDVTTVILHELGHMAGLEHSCAAFTGACSSPEKDAVMYYRYHGTLRTLQADDAAGIVALYPAPRAALPPAPPPPGGQLVPAPRPSQSPNLNVAVSLQPGWNLVALPAGPIDDTMRALPCVDAVFAGTSAGWESWARGPGALNTLAQIDATRSYWTHATAACSN